MSLQFSDTTTKKGILQRIERELGYPYGYITDDAARLASYTADINITHDTALALIFEAGGMWQFDDSNHTDYPIIRTDLADGQRDYPFTTDGSGNLILDIYKVLVKDENGTKRQVYPVDVQSNDDTVGFTDGLNIEGLPTHYDKTANGIFLDPIPSYNSSEGLEIYINREGSYFTTSDTTKKPGIAGSYHEYYVVRPAFIQASLDGLKNKKDLELRMLRLEEAITDHYGSREKDIRKVLKAKKFNFR